MYFRLSEREHILHHIRGAFAQLSAPPPNDFRSLDGLLIITDDGDKCVVCVRVGPHPHTATSSALRKNIEHMFPVSVIFSADSRIYFS